MIPALIAAGATLAGGAMASSATRSANKANQAAQAEANRLALQDKETDRALQKEFAQSGVQWRAADALKAGIHPLYALGGNFASYSPSPVSIGVASRSPDTSMGSAVASMGQDIGRAINSTRTGEQRQTAFDTTVQALTLQKMGLENDLLASQIKRLQVQSNPSFPSSAAADALKVAGIGVKKDPSFSDAQKFEDRYGEFVSDLIGPIIGWKDFMNTTGQAGVNTTNWPQAVGNFVWDGVKWLDKNIKPFGR